MIVDSEGYIIVKSAMQVNFKSDIARIMKNQANLEVNLTKNVIEGYLPELSLSDTQANMHRECHRLPDIYRSHHPVLKLHLELHSLDLKLFDGKDFDFLPSNAA